MADSRDLYAILGLTRSASEEEIRRAYRKLARKHHPDVNPGNADAEAKFKEVSAAFEVLSNPDKRKVYDEFGEEGLRGGFDPEKARAYRQWAQARQTSGAEDIPFEFDLGDLFGDNVGRGAPSARPRRRAGQDVVAVVDLDLAQALQGVEIELRVPVHETCGVCQGSGDKPGREPRSCPECGGSGRAQAVRGPMRMVTSCPRCGGEGKLREPCEACGGDGIVRSEEPLRVRIPKGADDGSELRVRGRGIPAMGGGPPGDLIIRTRLHEHPYFRREGLDLHLKLPVTFEEAYRGATVTVPTPTGPVQLKIPPRSQSGTRLRLRDRGVERASEKGDLYVDLDVRVPDRADEKFAEALADTGRLYSRPPREGIRL